MAISRPMLSESFADTAEIDRKGMDTAAALRVLAEQVWSGQQALADAIERLSLTLQMHLPASSGPSVVVNGYDVYPMASPATVAVHCLGEFQLSIAGAPVDIWRSARARSLFQFLVSHRAHPVPREVVLEALWPDPEAMPASTSLKVVVHRLRKALNSMGGRMGIDIQVGEDGYQVLAENMWVDVEQFEHEWARGRQLEASGQATAAVVAYASAAQLYRGDFLLDLDEEWAVLRRERLKDQYLHVLARLSDVALAAGDYDGCIERCQQILEHDHCREDAYRALMISHARLGQRGRVRRWYEVCQQRLRADLDVVPEAETELTYRRAMSGAFSQSQPQSQTPVQPQRVPSSHAAGITQLRV